jgi:hypothetical protein
MIGGESEVNTRIASDVFPRESVAPKRGRGWWALRVDGKLIVLGVQGSLKLGQNTRKPRAVMGDKSEWFRTIWKGDLKIK